MRASARRFVLPPPPRGMPRRLRAWYAVTAAVLSAVVAASAPFCPASDAQGRPAWRIEMINDGDTVTCLDTEGRQVRVRLVGIDAPELNQPKGHEARAVLLAKLAGGVVRVEGDARDQHGRVLGTLRLDDRNINREMVASGWAIAYRRHGTSYGGAETDARKDRRGIWQGDFETPERWRERQRNSITRGAMDAMPLPPD